MSITRFITTYRMSIFLLGCFYFCNIIICILPVKAEGEESSKNKNILSFAKKHELYIGATTVDNFWLLDDTSIYQEIYRREFNIVTPENQLKFGYTQPQRGVFSFSAADRHLQFAEQHHIAVHGHALLWHLFNPDWLVKGAFTRSDMLDIMNRHIDTVMGRYKGRIKLWDVINEPIEWDGTLRRSVWRDRIGDEFIELGLRRARQADPAAKLLINDYDIATLNRKSTGLYQLTKTLLEKGVPLDGIGFQMHLYLDKGIDLESFSENLQRFAALGLELYVTELDIAISKPVTNQALQDQAQMYRDIFYRLMPEKAVKGIQMWGFTDKYSWIDTHRPGYCCGLLFDKDLKTKLAYASAMAALSSGPTYFSPTVTLSAESFDSAQGVDRSGSIIFNVDGGDWIKFNNVDLKNGFDTLRVRYGNGNQKIGDWKVEVRLDSPSGTQIAELSIASTGGWGTLVDQTAAVAGGSGRHTLYFVFKGDDGVGNFDWFRFEGAKTETPRPAAPQRLRVNSAR